MRIRWPRRPERFLEQDLTRSIRYAIFAADFMRDPCFEVVNYSGKVIERLIEVSGNNKITEVCRILRYGAAQGVFECDYLFRISESYDGTRQTLLSEGG